jgi:titin
MTLSLKIHTPSDARPGSVTRATVTIHNSSGRVVAALLSIHGITGDWVQLDRDEVKLFPDERADVELVVQPRCDSVVVAGPHSFAIRAVVSDDPADMATDESAINVLEWAATDLELRPNNVRARRRAVATLTVWNVGNVRQAIGLEPGDDDDLLDVAIQPYAIALDPGERMSARVRLQLRPGATGAVPYSIKSAGLQSGTSTSVNGLFTVRRPHRFPIVAVAAAAVLAVGLAAIRADAGSVRSYATDATSVTDATTGSLATPSTSLAPITEVDDSTTVSTTTTPLAPVQSPDASTASVPTGGVSPTPSSSPISGATRTELPPAAENGPNGAISEPAVAAAAPAQPTSLEPAVVAPPRVPDPPGSVTAVPGDGSVSLTWSAPTNVAAAEIRSYTVSWSSDPVDTVEVLGTAAVVNGLVDGSTYVIAVQANAVDGTAGKPASSGAVTPSGVPGQTTVASASIGTASAVVSWLPADPRGSTVLDYTILVAPAVWGTPVRVAAAATTATINNLSPSTRYEVTVLARNANGSTVSSPLSIVTHTVPPTQPPPPPPPPGGIRWCNLYPPPCRYVP